MLPMTNDSGLGSDVVNRESPIGVFDSGMGGLTVLRELEKALPNDAFIYLGDTARLPYGTKSPATVRRYALRASKALVERGVSALVVACNTASSVALDALRSEYAHIPVFGVVQPGAVAAVHVSQARRIAVLATESTVRGGAYQRALLDEDASLEVRARACQLLVALAEEGWLTGDVPEKALRAYVEPWLRWQPDVILLGCTHFPVFRSLLQSIVGTQIELIDSAATTATEVARELGTGDVRPTSGSQRLLLATDDVARFTRVGEHFLGEAISGVELVDL